jgi:hypothetical protein
LPGMGKNSTTFQSKFKNSVPLEIIVLGIQNKEYHP